MSNDHEFDELARQKLEERTIPFDEGHWMEAQQLIAAQRKRRKGGAFWYAAGAGALVIGGWLFWQDSERMTIAGQPTKEVATTEQKMSVEGEDAAAGVERAANAEEVASIPEAVQVKTTDLEQVVRARSNEQVQPVHGSNDDATEGLAQLGSVAQQARSDENATDRTSLASTGTTGDVTVTGQVAAVIGGTDARPSTIGSSDPGNSSEAGSSDAPAGAMVAVPLDAAAAVVAAPTTTDVVDATHTPIPMDQAPIPDTSSVKSEATALLSASSTDSSTVATTPNDPTATPAQPAPILAPIIPARAPWELSLLGGIFQTSSKYAGGESDTWDVSNERTSAFGGELVHMGRNFGFGGGLHYGTYADRLRTPDEYRTDYVTNQSWYLALVDTTILIITGYDTISGFYTGQNVNVTISQLRSSLDSTSNTTLVCAGREQVNRTSYVEVVGLLDGHLVQGRWSFGIRGGPTFGLLTTRQGAIPTSDEGYIEFNDVAMHNFVLGWTARAYVRYRFNSAWSVGLEPAARGQLMDSFEDQGVTRRSNALGVMLSLSYRLP